MEELRPFYKSFLKALVAAERNYQQSKEDGDQPWIDYWHGVIDTYNRVLSDLENQFGLGE